MVSVSFSSFFPSYIFFHFSISLVYISLFLLFSLPLSLSSLLFPFLSYLPSTQIDMTHYVFKLETLTNKACQICQHISEEQPSLFTEYQVPAHQYNLYMTSGNDATIIILDIIHCTVLN
jgi:hypothetical protein